MIHAAAAANAAWRAGGGPEQALEAGAGGSPMGPVGLVIGATIGSLPPRGAQMIAQVGGPILAPGVGWQGAGAADLERLFGQARQLVLATSSRAVAGAGPDAGKLAAAVGKCAESVSFLGN
jgi:orotidine-5'-phosphate decarboxylase